MSSVPVFVGIDYHPSIVQVVDAARAFAGATDFVRSAGLRRPTERRAQLTPFLTKLRSSSAAALMRGRTAGRGRGHG